MVFEDGLRVFRWPQLGQGAYALRLDSVGGRRRVSGEMRGADVNLIKSRRIRVGLVKDKAGRLFRVLQDLKTKTSFLPGH